LCIATRTSFPETTSSFPFTLSCDNPANWNAAAIHWFEDFRRLRNELLDLQSQLDGLQSEIAQSIPDSIDLLNFSRRFTAFELSFTYPVGPVTVTIEIELSGGWGVHGVLVPALEFSPMRAGGGIEMRPTLEATAFAFAGAVIGQVSVGVSGEVLLVSLETPLRTELFLEQEPVDDARAPKVLQEALYALPADTPHAFPSGAKKYHWVANWAYG